jgi:osmotically-inducible protein OsmY
MKKHHWFVLLGAVIVGVAVFFQTTQLGNDDEVADAVVATLEGNPRIDASRLKVSVTEGDVTITGQIPGEEIRRIIIEEVERIDGIEHVIDDMSTESEHATESAEESEDDEKP